MCKHVLSAHGILKFYTNFPCAIDLQWTVVSEGNSSHEMRSRCEHHVRIGQQPDHSKILADTGWEIDGKSQSQNTKILLSWRELWA